MGGFKVAIIGAGRMGSLLTVAIPASCRKVIISRRKGGAVALADEVGGLASDQLSAVRGCRVIFLAVPGSAVHQVVQDMAAHLERGALVVNMATDVPTSELTGAFPNIRFAAAKVIGHAREMSHGSPGVVILDHVDAESEEQLRFLMEGLGSVVRDEEAKVQAINGAVVEVLTRTEEELRSRLTQLGLEPALARAAVATTGPGVLRALAEGEAVSFLQGEFDRARNGDQAATTVSH